MLFRSRAFGGLLSAGLSFDLVCQALINMGVVVHLGPITGQPLPFISWGGTAMIFSGISAGIILSVSKGERDRLDNSGTDANDERGPSNEMRPMTEQAA